MKIGGVVVPKGPNYELIPLFRDGKTFMLKMQTVTDIEGRDKVLPEPKAPEILKPGGARSVNLHDPDYVKAMAELNNKRFAWLVLKSLEPSDIEWETVDMANPDTWVNWEDELRANGCTESDISRIIHGISVVQGLDTEKIEKARNDFLASTEAAEKAETS